MRQRNEQKGEEAVASALDWIIGRIESEARKAERHARKSQQALQRSKGSAIGLQQLIEAGFLHPGPGVIVVNYQVRCGAVPVE